MSNNISAEKFKFIEFEIQYGDARRQKNALQDLCNLTRRGETLQASQKIGIEPIIVGLFSLDQADEKVLRWAINAIDQVFDSNKHVKQLEQLLKRHHKDIDISIPILSCLLKCKEENFQLKRIKSLTLPEEVILLAATQSGALSRIPEKITKNTHINIEKASSKILKSALVCVGLDKAQPNLFDPNHENESLVQVLGSHGDKIVQQYSLWAIHENSLIPIGAIGVDSKNVEKLPPNVRGWLYRALLKRGYSNSNWQGLILDHAFKEQDANALLELGRGLLEALYNEDLAERVSKLLLQSPDTNVRMNALGYLVVHDPAFDQYRGDVIENFKLLGPEQKNVILNLARGKPAYGQLIKNMLIGGQSDLMLPNNGDLIMVNKNVTNNIINIKGDNIGAASAGGAATTNMNIQVEVEGNVYSLSDFLDKIVATAEKHGKKDEIAEQVERLRREPTEGNFSQFMKFIKKIPWLEWSLAAKALFG